MGHTNSTANLSLPQFIGTDKPTWLGDFNGAMASIDAYAGTNDAAVAAVDAKADGAVSDASAAVATATAANNTAGTASTTATQANSIANNALTVANNADGHTNQLEQKVGLLADLHTTDKTSIVAAINEVADGSSAGVIDGALKRDPSDGIIKYYVEATQTWVPLNFVVSIHNNSDDATQSYLTYNGVNYSGVHSGQYYDYSIPGVLTAQYRLGGTWVFTPNYSGVWSAPDANPSSGSCTAGTPFNIEFGAVSGIQTGTITLS